MAGELQAQCATGLTLYAVILNAAGAAWNGAAFDASPTGGEWGSYDIAMPEDAATGYYRGDMPAAPAGVYAYRVHRRVGGSPASTDPVVWTGDVAWGGTAVVVPTGLSQAQAQAAAAAALAAYPVPLIGAIEDAIAAGSGATPATFWQYGERTMTQPAAQLAAALRGDTLTGVRGDTMVVNFTGLGSIAGRTALWFTVKKRPKHETDAQSQIQVKEVGGLLYIAGAVATGQSALGSIAVTNEATGALTLTVEAAAMAQLGEDAATWHWDLQWKTAAGKIHTLTGGRFVLDPEGDVTRATA